jgi:hypothetical protein
MPIMRRSLKGLLRRRDPVVMNATGIGLNVSRGREKARADFRLRGQIGIAQPDMFNHPILFRIGDAAALLIGLCVEGLLDHGTKAHEEEITRSDATHIQKPSISGLNQSHSWRRFLWSSAVVAAKEHQT